MKFLDSIWSLRLFYLLTAALTVLVFHQAFTASYVNWDDPIFIQENPLLQLPFPEFIRQIFTNFFFADYIPVTILSYWLEIQTFGADPGAQHAVNLLLHVLNIGLLILYLRKTGLRQSLITFTVLIFALHPLQTETVMWVSERKSLLAAFFGLAALNASENYQSPRDSKFWGLGYFLLFVLSLLSKSLALLLPVWLLASDVLWRQAPRRFAILKHVPTLIAALLFGFVRVRAYEGAAQDLAGYLWSWERWIEWPLQILGALGFYFLKFFWPQGQSAIYPLYLNSQSWITEIFTACVILSVGTFWLWRSRSKPALHFALLSLILLLPVLQVVPRINFVNDRYMYLPLIGWSVALGLALSRFFPARGLQVAFTLALAVTSYQRSRVWADNFSLWEDTARKNPGSGLANNSLGMEYMLQRKTQQALEKFEKATQVGIWDGTASSAYSNLGMIYSGFLFPELRDLPKAEEFYRQALSGSPNETVRARYNLGLVLLEQGKQDEARTLLTELQQFLQQTPDRQNEKVLILIRDLLPKIKSGT